MKKTIPQIENKLKKLKKAVDNKVKVSGICENLGEVEIREFEDFIGNIYDYDYVDRKKIEDMISSLRDFCQNYSL